MIVVTGGEGFIGQNLVKELQERGHIDIVSLDIKTSSLSLIYGWLLRHSHEIDCIYHLGAITDTTEMNTDLFKEYNVMSSEYIWSICTKFQIPLIYASSAATYGDGEEGFDDEKDINNLKPLNPYGQSKQQFDLWTLEQKNQPSFWYGLKFFNVYGYGELHKDNMASMVLHAYTQIINIKHLNLFKSHRADYEDGEQKRDFIYVDDVVDVCLFFQKEKPLSGIYNVGTGKARSFNDLAKAVFRSLGEPENITYIDTPIKIRDKYQYFTQAKMSKLINAGYDKPFHELEEGVSKYIKNLQDETS